MNENRFAVIYGSTEDYIDGLDNKNMNTATRQYGRSNAHGVLCRRFDTRRAVYQLILSISPQPHQL